jgi:hypothetical protein
MSHNSKYYVKKIKKSTDKDRKIDLMFKQAALSAETVTADETASTCTSEKLPSTVSVSYRDDDVPSGFKSSSNEYKSDSHTVVPVPDQRLFSSNKYELKYDWLYYSGAKVGYCCKLCELFSATDDNVFINGTGLGDHPTRKLESHLNGKSHKNSLAKYVLVNTSSTKKVKKTVADM